MNIRLKRLRAINFKGIGEFEYEFCGNSAVILAENGRGKTSIADAYFWVVSDLDSQGQGKFGSAPVDESGQEIKDLEVSVEIDLDIDGVELQLCKIQRQKWTKRRKPVFKGHEFEYFINDLGAPVSKKNFYEVLHGYMPADLWRILSDVYFLPSRMKADKRREFLIATFKPEDNKPPSQELSEILAGRKIENVKIGLDRKLKRLKLDLEILPSTIKGLRESLCDDGYNEADIRTKIADIDREINQRYSEIASLKSGEANADIKNRQADLAKQYQAIIDADNADTNKEIEEIGEQAIETREKLDENLKEIHNLRGQILDLQNTHFSLSQEKSRLADQFREIKKEARGVCPACGQLLPHAETAEKRNENAEKLKAIDISGRQIVQQLKEIDAKIDAKQAEIAAINQTCKELRFHGDQLSNQIRKLKQQIGINGPPNAHKGLEEIVQKQVELQRKLDKALKSKEPLIREIEAQLEPFQEDKNRLYEILGKITSQKDIRAKIEAKEAELKRLGKEEDQVQYNLDIILAERERRAKLIEEQVNDHFNLITWKLFDIPIDGDPRLVCDATVDGVPFTVDLNTGNRINAGLDGIVTISNVLGITAPVWVDNAESVTGWIPIENQQIIKLAAQVGLDHLEVRSV